jgi:hypothetical protein
MDGQDAVAVYDELTAKLAAGTPLSSLPSGTAEREFTLVDGNCCRALILRGTFAFPAGAASPPAQEDLVLWLACYDALSLGQETLEPFGPTFFRCPVLWRGVCGL